MLTLAAGLCLMLAACSGPSDSTSPSASAHPSAPSLSAPTTTESASSSAPDYAAAFEAGYIAGKRLYDEGGKGGAVREVNGGCVRRSLTAMPSALVARDRGAWVLGCKQGAGNSAPRPPSTPITRRENAPDLRGRFRDWATDNGATDTARHVERVTLVHLGRGEYDVELSTTYSTADATGAARRLADTFATWWDGDDGDGVAWNLIITDAGGHRLTDRQLVL
ncbi:hypothetical protein GCM10009601_48560 [Streptomyces thermospinosisporus]|uniref:Lipoprotein n=1 Tax=Streptomyces thermospinosisporus TaxID=161482 RepID=A0ABP4JXD6_9ACTN